jgi:hypothetical protein
MMLTREQLEKAYAALRSQSAQVQIDNLLPDLSRAGRESVVQSLINSAEDMRELARYKVVIDAALTRRSRISSRST